MRHNWPALLRLDAHGADDLAHNPAVTVARALSNSFAGIAPSSAPGFIAAQCIGALLALLMVRYLLRAAS
jgi:glycerol uptake facilitator-like aquaporin